MSGTPVSEYPEITRDMLELRSDLNSAYAEIASLRAQLDEANERAHYATGVAETNIKRANEAANEARRRAIEDAAQAAKPFDDPENKSDYERGFFEGRRHAEQEVRALLSESKT